jgi:hypothetical protein
MKNAAVLMVVAPLLLFHAACTSDRGGLPTAGGTTTNGKGLATTKGASVLSSDVTQASLRNLGGGYVAPAPANAPCQLGVSTFTVAFAPPTLTFSRCQETGDFNVATSYVPQNGQRALNATELSMVRTALGAVSVSDRRVCGADKGQVELEVATSTQSLTYGDDFYGCVPNYTAFVDTASLDNLYAVLNELAD